MDRHLRVTYCPHHHRHHPPPLHFSPLLTSPHHTTPHHTTPHHPPPTTHPPTHPTPHTPHPTPHNHHHHQPFHASVPIFFCVACIVKMVSGQPSSAAQRRRGRRLRAILRHEQQSIAISLAAAEMQQNAALRGQTTVTGAREEVVKVTHDA